MKEASSTPQQQLRSLLEAGDEARRALGRLDADRGRLEEELAVIEASVRELQEGLPLAARLQVQEEYLASQLRRLDAEIAEHEPARAGKGVASAPGGIERRASPRPAPIPMPRLEPPVEIPRAQVAPSAGLLDRARRVFGTQRERARPY